MQHLTFKQVGNRGKANVRVRPNIHAFARRNLGRPYVIEKYEWPNSLSLFVRQQAADAELAQVLDLGTDL
jgi:hypothetical protein